MSPPAKVPAVYVKVVVLSSTTQDESEIPSYTCHHSNDNFVKIVL